jgi:hypothetical protein
MKSLASAALLVGCLAPLACGGSVQNKAAISPARDAAAARPSSGGAKATPARQVRADLPPANSGLKIDPNLNDRERAQAELVGAIVRGGVSSIGFGKRREGLEPRDQFDPISFRVAELPVGRVPRALDAAKAPSALPLGGEPSDLLIDWRGGDPAAAKNGFVTVRLAVQGDPMGRLRVGTNESSLSGSGAGVYVTCGTSPGARPMILPARWETVTKSGDTLLYTVTDAWFDARECRGHLVGRSSVQARRLPSGLLYAFRACAGTGDACGDESITFIGPRANMVSATGIDEQRARAMLGSFSFVVLPVRRGAAGAFVERIASHSLKEWYKMTGTEARFERDVVLGVDIVQGVEDPEPVAISYVNES